MAKNKRKNNKVLVFTSINDVKARYANSIEKTSKMVVNAIEREFRNHISSMDYKYYDKILEKHRGKFNILFNTDVSRIDVSTAADYRHDKKFLLRKGFAYLDYIIEKKRLFSKKKKVINGNLENLIIEKIEYDLKHINSLYVKKVFVKRIYDDSIYHSNKYITTLEVILEL